VKALAIELCTRVRLPSGSYGEWDRILSDAELDALEEDITISCREPNQVDE
jgi:hypothetical protein